MTVYAILPLAVPMFPDEAKMKAQYPLLAAMVVFTLGGIFLLVGT